MRHVCVRVLQFAQCNALQIPSAMLIIRYVYHRAFEEYRVISKHSDFAHVLGPLVILVTNDGSQRNALQSSQSCPSMKKSLLRSTSNLDFSDLVENIHPCKVGCFLQNDYFFNLHCDQS